MISAEEARKMLVENFKNKTNEIKNIEDKIKIAISKNESHIGVNPSVSIDTELLLKDLGYIVENRSKWGETYTIIHW